MEIRILSVDLERFDASTRMPFKYGIATMTHLPHVFLRVDALFDGVIQKGISADHLPPKWFTKDPEKDPLEEIEDMLLVIGNAGELAQRITSTFAHLLHENAFGICWESIRPELKGKEPKDLFPPPLESITIRHTVGMADPLTEEEISEDERIHDGLPQSLESCIHFYGVNHFKIKVNGQLEPDIERLGSIEKLFNRLNLVDFAFTLDGNEQFHEVSSFRAFWNSLQESERMRTFFEHLVFVEQPFHRDLALTEPIGDALKSWTQAPPIIIDESDATLDSAFTALQLGYRGTSHKNCKGVFKGIINRAMINQRNLDAGTRRFLMSGEDLANIGPVANHMDLVVQACLGNASVERNGHHYFKGLSLFNASIQESALNNFPDLYVSESNYVRLNIQNGVLPVHELLSFPFGTDHSHF